MTIARTYSAGWGVFEKLTSAQLNAIDTALTYAVDGRTGASGICGSNLTFGGIYTGGTWHGATMLGGNIGVASGLATLGGDGAIATGQRGGWLVDTQEILLPSTLSIQGLPAGTLTTIASMPPVYFSARAGDRMLIDAEFVGYANGLQNAYLGFRVTEASQSRIPAALVRQTVGSAVGTSTSDYFSRAMSAHFVATAIGTCMVELVGGAVGILSLHGATAVNATHARITQWRP